MQLAVILIKTGLRNSRLPFKLSKKSSESSPKARHRDMHHEGQFHLAPEPIQAQHGPDPNVFSNRLEFI